MENLYHFIEFDIDNLNGLDDRFVIIYSYFNQINYITEVKTFNNKGISSQNKYQSIQTDLEETSNPIVSNFSVNTPSGSTYHGYVIIFCKNR